MKELREYQTSFYKAIFTNDSILLQNSIGPIEDLEDRFKIYSNNIFSSLKNVLKDDFPVCQRILGEEKFNQAAFEFVRNFPPTSGCLLDYGQKFPRFLEVFFPTFPYIKDIARLEWAKKEIYYTSNTYPLDPRIINSIPADEYASLTFTFPKAIFFLKSDFFVKDVWEASEKHKRKIKDPRSTSSYALIIRPRLRVEHFWLNSEEFYFLTTLHEGKTLGEAYDRAVGINSEFNLSEALELALRREYFTNAEVSHENRTPI